VNFLLSVISIIKASYAIRRYGAIAVVTANPSPIDVRIGCTVSKIARVIHVVFVNAVPLTGYVGYKSANPEGLSSLQWILNVIRHSRKQLTTSIIEAISYYIMFKCLMDSVVVPLTPDVASTLRKMGLTCVEPISGVGCTRFRTSGRRWIDAVYVASPLHPDKGVYNIVDIWELVSREKPNAKLLIVGREELHYNLSLLNQYLWEKKLKNVKILSSKQGIPNEIVINIMSQAKLFVYPTKKDVTPLVISEALGCGTPVITYDLPGIRLAYGNCEAVIRITTGDKKLFAQEVLRLLNNQKELEKLREAAIKWCDDNSWQKVALKTLYTYLKAILLGYYLRTK